MREALRDALRFWPDVIAMICEGVADAIPRFDIASLDQDR